ncbi:hypothetical protein LIG30_1171 [Burkholderia sp. lig30]|uniref:hypothetical protein n=1 Tax=Burkholderia sp. lig30 TaxID=1192124 RepID=UPI00046131F8|nr:hypothetical protein [Burkholderia sp. lig30]KDB09969.1 hypothetical protein LIG30_1171 [Burkholderia sp. lig30]
MPIWNLPSTSEVPEVTLSQWRILETDDGSRHFVGTDVLDLTGRVSSAVVAFDRVALRGKTLSGRVYQLVGKDGWSSNAEYVWKGWCGVNKVKSYSDVTAHLLNGADDDNPA